MIDMTWTDDYPDQERLRSEVRAMGDACAGALLACIPEGDIVSIFLKGSGCKRWDSPIDYVPELSDVDVHVRLQSDEAMAHHLGTVDAALTVCAETEQRFATMIPDPLHFPRPQLIVVNELVAMLDYVPSPRCTVTVLYGPDDAYPMGDYSDAEHLRGLDRANLLVNEPELARLPLRAIDKPGRYMTSLMRQLAWRVGPIGPRVLSLLGMDYAQAWSLNRTGLAAELEACGEDELARHYREFYLGGWRFFLSGYEDSAAARASVSAGVRVLERGVAIAQT